ncbi:PH domain-containing protein [Cellulomonas oligotrophica]|uniref:YokE-like PH domain-containing protein n=1 Tax=Cellulomonas oligotrophica TaxID=931536 RepID=A0A7Y9FDA1_9CELL|nr:PH domain-containing protein [Cellulomonas oligotrophica]NYD85050.1 hypothetical protein [Cellulomonas oligotrophica]GIG33755.1 hypothetical protein Col01nite_29140 [Cellulomonas oligotrophica]
MADVPHDKREQLDKVREGLLEGEQVLAVYDCTGTGTGFVGLTDLRIVFQDNSFVGKRTAITSVPYKQVRSVSIVTDKSWTGGFFSGATIAVDAGGTVHEAEFRGVEKARHVHDVVLHHIVRGR